MDVSRIGHGPRAEALTTSLHEASVALSAPIADDERDAGWTNELVDAIRDTIDEAAARLARDPLDRVDPIGDVGIEAIDEPSSRLDAVLAPEMAMTSLEIAEAALAACTQLLELLERDATSRRDGDVSAATRDELARCATAITRRLEAGAYLEGPEVAAWVALLAANGVLRREGPPPEPGSDVLTPGTGSVSDYPRGRLWTEVCLCDQTLVALTLADVGWPPPESLTT